MKEKIRGYLRQFLMQIRFTLLHVIEETKIETEQKRTKEILNDLAFVGSESVLAENTIITIPKMVIVGQNVHIGPNGYFDTMGGLIIDDNVHIERNVTIITSERNFDGALPHDEKYQIKQIIIKENAWIGMHAILLPGVTVGEGAVIGPGSVISKDVPPGGIAGNPSLHLAGKRDEKAYIKLSKQNKLNVKTDLPFQNTDLYENGHELGDRLFFVLSTGRSGSKAISFALSQNPKVSCRHEISPFIIKLSTDYAYGRYSEDYFLDILDEVYGKSKRIPKGELFGESNQKLTVLAPLLHKLFPKAKFIWMIRNGKDVVSSIYGRDWYWPEHKNDTELFNPNHRTWDNYRIDGDKVGQFTTKEWNNMTRFEKNCWYWVYWNDLIEDFFKVLPEEQKLMIKLEDFNQNIDNIQNFLNVEPVKIQTQKINKAYYVVKSHNQWDEAQKIAFEKICGPTLTKWNYL